MAEKEYIERDKLLELYVDGEYDTADYHISVPVIIQNIKDIPAADVRPVVTCGRCKYADSFSPTCTESTFPLKCLSIRYGGVYPDWFCEHGEIAQKSNCGADMREES